jgi:RNA polymerase sigma-70 factor (ECF subfamily)
MIFILRYWYVAPIGEIAERLHFSEGKVKSVLFRTRRKLHTYLQEEGLC